MKIGFPGLLTIVLITLKLLDKINWSWVWVLAPLWIGFVFFGFFAVFALMMAVITGQLKIRRR